MLGRCAHPHRFSPGRLRAAAAPSSPRPARARAPAPRDAQRHGPGGPHATPRSRSPPGSPVDPGAQRLRPRDRRRRAGRPVRRASTAPPRGFSTAGRRRRRHRRAGDVELARSATTSASRAASAAGAWPAAPTSRPGSSARASPSCSGSPTCAARATGSSSRSPTPAGCAARAVAPRHRRQLPPARRAGARGAERRRRLLRRRRLGGAADGRRGRLRRSAARTRPGRPPCTWRGYAKQRHARRAGRVARRPACRTTWSAQIEATPNIEVRLGHRGRRRRRRRLARAPGAARPGERRQETVDADALFLMIGAQPHTEWLPPEIERDARGFVLTGTRPARDVAAGRSSRRPLRWRRACRACSRPATSGTAR